MYTAAGQTGGVYRRREDSDSHDISIRLGGIHGCVYQRPKLCDKKKRRIWYALGGQGHLSVVNLQAHHGYAHARYRGGDILSFVLAGGQQQ